MISLSAGVVAGLVATEAVGWRTGLLAAWTVAALVFLVWTWSAIWPLDAADTQALAQREDPGRVVRDIVFLVIAVVTVLTVAVVIFHAHESGVLRLVLGVACIVVSWAVLHTILTLRYAKLYYADPRGGIDFNQTDAPVYRDFAYLAFTVGMTFQIADTDVTQSRVRSTVLGHAIVSFVFSVVIIGVTVNLVAGLSS